MSSNVTVSAVILAAGSSTRMGVPKQFLPLHGQPLLAHTLLAFQACDAIQEIVVVARLEDIEKIKELAQAKNITKLTKVVEGGSSRRESARCGAQACNSESKYFAVHDGARPLITPQIIEEVVSVAKEYGAAAAAVPTKDTIKQVDANGFVVGTPPREMLWNVQTPQIFRRDLYLQALDNCEKTNTEVTDDCQMVELLGHTIKLVKSSYTNIKVTTPEDINIAEGWL